MPATLKDPWQMTRAEYVEGARAWRAEYKSQLTGKALEAELLGVAHGHKRHVENALGAGKPVSPEVLADYPELRPAKGPTEALCPRRGKETLLVTIAAKWRVATARNSVLAQKDLETLKAKGYEIEDAEDALEAYRDTQRSDFESAEEFSEARGETWEEFLNALDDVEELDEVEEVQDKQPLTVVECDRQYSLSELKSKARAAGISTSGDKKALCRKLIDAGAI